MGRLPNNEMNLTKPAQATGLRRLSQCSTDLDEPGVGITGRSADRDLDRRRECALPPRTTTCLQVATRHASHRLRTPRPLLAQASPLLGATLATGVSRRVHQGGHASRHALPCSPVHPSLHVALLSLRAAMTKLHKPSQTGSGLPNGAQCWATNCFGRNGAVEQPDAADERRCLTWRMRAPKLRPAGARIFI